VLLLYTHFQTHNGEPGGQAGHCSFVFTSIVVGESVTAIVVSFTSTLVVFSSTCTLIAPPVLTAIVSFRISTFTSAMYRKIIFAVFFDMTLYVTLYEISKFHFIKVVIVQSESVHFTS
jgi:hypothetical protein